MATSIGTLTSKGSLAPATIGGSGKLASVGTEIDGKVYQRPRVTNNMIGRGSSKVKVTNPRASETQTNRRNISLGMAGALSARREY
jgi:hypothetical protein